MSSEVTGGIEPLLTGRAWVQKFSELCLHLTFAIDTKGQKNTEVFSVQEPFPWSLNTKFSVVVPSLCITHLPV